MQASTVFRYKIIFIKLRRNIRIVSCLYNIVDFHKYCVLQHTRHYDFVLNFGSYLTDVAIEKKLPDPAEENPELLAKLQENR